jgi:flagellar biosynthetic protein FlhB
MAETVGSEKTEKATPKKRRDARAQGNVLKSHEVDTAFCAIIMFAFMGAYWPTFTENLLGIYTDFLNPAFLSTSADNPLTLSYVSGLLMEAALSFIILMLPVLGVAIVSGVVANIAQVGLLFTTKNLRPKFNRISPLQGFKRILSPRSLIELLKSTVKVFALGYIAYTEYTGLLDEFNGYMAALSVYDAFVSIIQTAFSICLRMCLVLAIIAAVDDLIQWRKFEKDLMMTKQEVKDEYKNTEGDPQIKSRIRQKQRQMSAMRMMEAVPDADVVITNPTHFAVALKYKQGVDPAPRVLAKGQDYMAQKIKAVAREHGIEIVENKPLAQALYNMCEVNDEIPEEFYKAVADILVYVYKRKNPYLV